MRMILEYQMPEDNDKLIKVLNALDEKEIIKERITRFTEYLEDNTKLGNTYLQICDIKNIFEREFIEFV